MKSTTWVRVTAMTGVFGLGLGIWGSFPNQVTAQTGHQTVDAPKFEVDPFWPKPLPDNWITGDVAGTCVDARDHVFIANRRNLTTKELLFAKPAPPIIEFDTEGNVVNSWGDPKVLPA